MPPYMVAQKYGKVLQQQQQRNEQKNLRIPKEYFMRFNQVHAISTRTVAKSNAQFCSQNVTLV